MVKILLLLWMGSSLAFARDYKLPPPKPLPSSSALQQLQQVSKGISKLSVHASQAIVFVSVSKTIRGRPFGEIDPFEFFFGPQYRQRQPERKQKGLGSGFFVDLEKGYVVTNNHVIEGADEISLKLANGKVYQGKVIGRDESTDVAVVRINDDDFDRKGIKALSLGTSQSTEVGEIVIAVGAPFGLESSVSLGVLSARGRGNLDITDVGNFLQTDAAINPGNSGGPLLNSQGEVIGMNTAIYSRSGGSAGIGFAVPAELVARIVVQLINHGSFVRGYLGVTLQPLTPDVATALGLSEDAEGAIVAYVFPDTPAKKAGLEDGDVIVKVGGKATPTYKDVMNAIGINGPGTTVEIEFFRKGKKKSAKILLGSYPSSANAPKIPSAKEAESLAGLNLEEFNPKVKSYSEWKQTFALSSSRGLLVTGVAPNSAAEAAGIRQGDLLLKADGQTLHSVSQFEKLFKKKSKILIQLERQGQYSFASIRK